MSYQEENFSDINDILDDFERNDTVDLTDEEFNELMYGYENEAYGD